MEKQLKDYIQFYIGCRCLNTWFSEGHSEYNPGWILSGYDSFANRPFHLVTEVDETWTDSIKPILRDILDMTDEEKPVYHSLCREATDGVHAIVVRYDTPESFHYLLKQGFDLFGLLDAGLGVDETLTK